jgi:hypothetical protein
LKKTAENQYGEMEMRMADNVAMIMENMVSGWQKGTNQTLLRSSERDEQRCIKTELG